MSEEKIIKHTKGAITVLHDDNKPFREKIKSFFEEIIVIIIAVSITLMFHNWNDRRHENELAENFLTGIAADLRQNASNLNSSVKGFQPTINYYDNVFKQIKAKHIDARYVDTLSQFLLNTNYFVFDNSRFEGFKSSGYLRLIRNEQLLKEIVTMYAIVLPFEKDADINIFHTRYDDFNHYIGVRAEIDTAGNVLVSKLLNDPAVRYQYYINAMILKERMSHRTATAKRMLALADDIDKELKK